LLVRTSFCQSFSEEQNVGSQMEQNVGSQMEQNVGSQMEQNEVKCCIKLNRSKANLLLYTYIYFNKLCVTTVTNRYCDVR
jgi:hypothetical protein